MEKRALTIGCRNNRDKNDKPNPLAVNHCFQVNLNLLTGIMLI